LISVSSHKLDRVVEGLLHVYSELIKNEIRAISETSSNTSNSSSNNLLLLAQQENGDHVEDRFTRSKIIIYQLMNSTLSSVINYDKLDLHLENDFSDELYVRNTDGNANLQRFDNKKMTRLSSFGSGDAMSPSTPVTDDSDTTSSHDESKIVTFDEVCINNIEQQH
jgi:hypothetical protein